MGFFYLFLRGHIYHYPTHFVVTPSLAKGNLDRDGNKKVRQMAHYLFSML